MDLQIGSERLAKMMGMSVQQMEADIRSNWTGIVVPDALEMRCVGDARGLGSKPRPGPQYFPRLPRRVAEDDAWRNRGVQLVLAWFRSHWKSQTQCGKGEDDGIPFFEPVEDTTTWNFNESFRSSRVPSQRLRAADVGPTADAPSILLDSNKETLYHGTRAGVLCLILRDGLRSSPKSHNVTGVWLTEDLEWGFHWGRRPLDEFPGCVVEVEVDSVRRNRQIGSGKAVLEAMAEGHVPDAELKAVHLQIPSEDWVAFVKDFRTAIWEVACAFPGGNSGRRQKNSYLIELTTSRCSCFQVATSAWWKARREKYPVCTEALSLCFLGFLRPLEIEGQVRQRERLESLQWALLPKPMQSFFIRQFGDDFPKLCNEEAVCFDSESLQVLQNTQVCSARKVENDAVGEEEAMQRVRQAVMEEYAASRVQSLGLPPTNLAAYETSDSSDIQRARANNASNVENDAMGEEEAMQTRRQAVMQYAASRVQGLAIPPTNHAAYESSHSSDMQHGKRARLE